jgi:hypothetical protein
MLLNSPQRTSPNQVANLRFRLGVIFQSGNNLSYRFKQPIHSRNIYFYHNRCLYSKSPNMSNIPKSCTQYINPTNPRVSSTLSPKRSSNINPILNPMSAENNKGIYRNMSYKIPKLKSGIEGICHCNRWRNLYLCFRANMHRLIEPPNLLSIPQIKCPLLLIQIFVNAIYKNI